jgi:plasmid stabilization system protein ParE
VNKVYVIRYSPAALRDLDKISDDLEEAHGTSFADTYVDELRSRIGTLSASPGRYNLRSRLGKNLRLMPELPYHVIYRVEADVVVIVRVVHGRRRITRRSIDHDK